MMWESRSGKNNSDWCRHILQKQWSWRYQRKYGVCVLFQKKDSLDHRPWRLFSWCHYPCILQGCHYRRNKRRFPKANSRRCTITGATGTKLYPQQQTWAAGKTGCCIAVPVIISTERVPDFFYPLPDYIIINYLKQRTAALAAALNLLTITQILTALRQAYQAAYSCISWWTNFTAMLYYRKKILVRHNG